MRRFGLALLAALALLALAAPAEAARKDGSYFGNVDDRLNNTIGFDVSSDPPAVKKGLFVGGGFKCARYTTSTVKDVDIEDDAFRYHGRGVPTGGTRKQEGTLSVRGHWVSRTRVKGRVRFERGNCDSGWVDFKADWQYATADLATRVSGPDSAARGSTATYEITVRNRGPSTVRVTLDVNVDPPRGNQLSPNRGSCAEQPHQPGAPFSYTCRLGTLEPGEKATITVTHRIDQCDFEESVLVDAIDARARSASGSRSTDPDSSNNNAQKETAVTGPIGGSC